MKALYFDRLAPPPRSTRAQIRTVSAWGEETQADLTRVRIGAGSVRGVIADALARTGFEDILLLDFDRAEKQNLNRLLYTLRRDIGCLKVDVLAEHLRARTTVERFHVEPLRAAVYEEEAFRAALRRPHLLRGSALGEMRHEPDGLRSSHPSDRRRHRRAGQSVGKLAAADWRAHTATPTRPCLQCLGQYDAGSVQLERESFFDDPTYIAGLLNDHPLKARENVYAFSLLRQLPGSPNARLCDRTARSLESGRAALSLRRRRNGPAGIRRLQANLCLPWTRRAR